MLNTLPRKGYTMKQRIVKLGSATRRTKDFSGFYTWDAFLFDFRRMRPWG